MSNKFRLNQYNWLGQKLLGQHRYSDILKLSQYSRRARSELPAELDLLGPHSQVADMSHLSDHLSYLSGLALMKTQSGQGLDELIMSLQRLNFQKSNQYFLLLCQCLLYLGNHDSIVALCKQLFNKQIDAVSLAGSQLDAFGTEDNQERDDDDRQATKSSNYTQSDWSLQWLSEESLEFKKVFEVINGNRLINEPKLWFIFGLSLEFQLQFKDADLAYRVASKLALGAQKAPGDNNDDNPLVGSNFHLPHSRYAEFLVRQKGDFKSAIQVLAQATQGSSPTSSPPSSPADYTLGPQLALLMSQAGPNMAAKSSDILAALDAHSISSRNPSFAYNQLALKCKLKLLAAEPNNNGEPLLSLHQAVNRIGNETRCNLDYNLVRVHVTINSLLLVGHQAEVSIFKCPNQAKMASSSSPTVDRLIEELRGCDSSCWSSSSGLWNNLGVCYLIRRRYVASLTCFMKAHQMSPLDWRINYNLALAYQHVGLAHRALVCLLAARSFSRDCNRPAWELSEALKRKRWATLRATTVTSTTTTTGDHNACVSTLLAACLGELRLGQEARRVYAEMAAKAKTSSQAMSSLALVNYLLLLSFRLNCLAHSNSKDAELDLKLIGRLLDQLEQMWLQRDQNDAQFPAELLEVAQSVAVQMRQLVEGRAEHKTDKLNVRQTFAWTK